MAGPTVAIKDHWQEQRLFLSRVIAAAIICIVLSGTGSDGTLGLGAVKGAGGMTMAQAEEQAKKMAAKA